MSGQTESLLFPGTTGYVDLGNPSQLEFGQGGVDLPFSVSLWFKMSSYAATQVLAAKYDQGAANLREWNLIFVTASNFLAFDEYDSSGNSIGRQCPFSSALYGTTWHHLLCTYDASKLNSGNKIYVDGTRVDNADNTSGSYSAMSATATHTILGARFNSSPTIQLPYSGSLANVQIFNRALTSAEATTLSLGGAVTSGLVGSWQLSEGTGTTAYDWSGNADNGTLSGAAKPAYQVDAPSQISTLFGVPFKLASTGVLASFGSPVQDHVPGFLTTGVGMPILVSTTPTLLIGP